MRNTLNEELQPEQGETIKVVYPYESEDGDCKVIAQYGGFAVVYAPAPLKKRDDLLHDEYLVINKEFNTIDYHTSSYVQAVASMVQMGNLLDTVNEALDMSAATERAEESGLVVPNKKIQVPDTGGNFGQQ